MNVVSGPPDGHGWHAGSGGGPVDQGYRLSRTVIGRIGRVVVSGEIDCDCVGAVEEVLRAAVTERAAACVIVDLSRLRFMDARCAGILLGAKRLADRRGVALQVAGAAGLPRLVLEVLGLYDELRRPCAEAAQR